MSQLGDEWYGSRERTFYDHLAWQMLKGDLSPAFMVDLALKDLRLQLTSLGKRGRRSIWGLQQKLLRRSKSRRQRAAGLERPANQVRQQAGL